MYIMLILHISSHHVNALVLMYHIASPHDHCPGFEIKKIECVGRDVARANLTRCPFSTLVKLVHQCLLPPSLQRRGRHKERHKGMLRSKRLQWSQRSKNWCHLKVLLCVPEARLLLLTALQWALEAKGKSLNECAAILAYFANFVG